MSEPDRSDRVGRPIAGAPAAVRLALALIVSIAWWAPAPAVAQPRPSTDDDVDDVIRAEMDSICHRLREGDDAYFGEGSARRAKEAFETVTSPVRKAFFATTAGIQLFRLGHLDQAIEWLETALILVDAVEAEGDFDPARIAASRGRLLEGLGLVHLRRAEDRNCLGMRTPASCILPIRPDGVHMHPEEASRAAGYFAAALRATDDAGIRVTARWLLDLARMLDGSYPASVPPELRVPPGVLDPPDPPKGGGEPFPRWIDVAGRLGVAGAGDLSGGAVMDDFDGDGLLDLVSTSWDPCEPMKAFRGDGRGGFEEVTGRWGLDVQLGGLNLVHSDFDGDGDLDLLVLRGGWLGADGAIRNSLLRNDLSAPAGRFVDVTVGAGLAFPAYPTQTAAWADYDGDGDLDLAVGNESPVQSTQPSTLSQRTGLPYPSQLFENRGDGTFVDVARQAGVTNLRFAKGVTWGDYDDDGDPDLYVSNIGANRLYRNLGDGTFDDVAREAGVAEPSRASFATWFFDYDQDGDLDLWVGSYSAPVETVLASYLGVDPPDAPGGSRKGGTPVVYRNDGGRFTDVSPELGLTRPLLPMGANFGDLDSDGYPDVHLGTGVPDFDALMPNVTYRNAPDDRPEGGGGRRFVDVTFAGGFGQLQKGHGVAFGDFDRDGDQDMFQQLGGAFPYDRSPNALLENPTSEARPALVDRGRARRRARQPLRRRRPARSTDPIGGSGTLGPRVGRVGRLVRRLQPGPGDGSGRRLRARLPRRPLARERCSATLRAPTPRPLLPDRRVAQPVGPARPPVIAPPSQRSLMMRPFRAFVLSFAAVCVLSAAFTPATAQAPANDEGAALLDRAMAELEKGRLDQAIALLEPVRAQQPAPEPLLSVLGALYVEAGRAEDAIAVLEPLTTADDAPPAVLYNAGRASMLLGDVERAESYLQRSVDMEPATPAARELGLLRGTQGRLREAYQLLMPWARSHPDDTQSRRAAAMAALRLERVPQAEEMLADLPQSDPQNRILWGQLLLVKGEPHAAIALLAPLLAGGGSTDGGTLPEPVASDVRRILAESYIEVGEAAEAVAVLDGRVDSAITGLLLGRAQYQNGDLDDALATLEPLARPIVGGEHDPADPRWQLATDIAGQYGRTLLAAGRHEDAIPYLSVAAQMAPDVKETWQALGQALVAAGRREEAEQALARFQSLADEEGGETEQVERQRAMIEDPTARELARARALVETGEQAAALTVVRREAELSPTDPRPRLYESWLLLSLDRPDEAYQAADTLVRSLPESPDALHQRGATLMALDRLDEAETDFRRALELSPGHVPALNDLAVLLIVRGDRAEARTLLERVLEIHPEDVQAQRSLERLRDRG